MEWIKYKLKIKIGDIIIEKKIMVSEEIEKLILHIYETNQGRKDIRYRVGYRDGIRDAITELGLKIEGINTAEYELKGRDDN